MTQPALTNEARIAAMVKIDNLNQSKDAFFKALVAEVMNSKAGTYSDHLVAMAVAHSNAIQALTQPAPTEAT